MLRWLAVGALAAVCVAACHSAAPAASGDDDAGDDDGSGACAPCMLFSASISCGAVACVDGTEYRCASGGEGVVEIGVCDQDASAAMDTGFVTIDAHGADSSCTPICFGSCNVDDTCGGTCNCSGAEVCDMSTDMCSNGCENVAGDPCVPGSVSLTLCCIDNLECNPNDAGLSHCCAEKGIPGLCVSSADCCGYPTITCNTSTGQCQ